MVETVSLEHIRILLSFLPSVSIGNLFNVYILICIIIIVNISRENSYKINQIPPLWHYVVDLYTNRLVIYG